MKHYVQVLFGLFCIGLVLGSASDAFAESKRSGVSIAVIDYQLILRDSKAMKGVRAQIEKQRKTFQVEITEQEKKLRQDEQSLNQQRAVLSSEAFAKKQREFQAKYVEFQGHVQSKRQQLKQAHSQASITFEQKVVSLVGGVAKKEGFDLVFAKSQIIHVAPQFDITAQTLRQLDKQLPTLKVSVPKQ